LTTLTQQKEKTLNAVVYMDHDTISEILIKQFGKDLMETDFFKAIQKKLEKYKALKIIDFIVYGDFERPGIKNSKQQTLLRAMGLQTRQVSYNGKSCGDLELTVDAIQVLYKNPSITAFVFISSDRDLIPLLTAIRYESKVSYVLSFRSGFNKTVAEFADNHGYLEDIFHLTPITKAEQAPDELRGVFDLGNLKDQEIDRAKEVCRYLYNSNIWRRSAKLNEPINLKRYIEAITKALNRSPGSILNDFKVAHHLRYITIYQDKNLKLCVKQGEMKDSIC
jgi:uncharacterized LabA/DUF88 family protein